MEEEKTNDPLTFSPVEEEDNEELSDDDDGSTSSSEDAEEWNNTTIVQHELKTSRAASKAENEPTKPAMVKLEDQMNNKNLETLQKIFEEADEDGGGGLDMDEFRQAMIKTMTGRGEVPDDNQLAITFMKVDANCDGTVDWEEFCSYMLLETQLKDVMTSEDREMEFPNPAKEVPSSHRDTITRITYLPKLSHGTDDPTDSNGGRYVSVSKEGTLHFWNMDLYPQRTLSLGHEGKASKNVWITDCVVLPNVKKLALSTADREIAFYDCAATSFDKQYVICSLDYCVLTMDYWCSSPKSNEGILLGGDAGGSVICFQMKFNAMTGCLFDINLGQQIPSVSFRRFSLWELQQGRYSNIKLFQFNNLHEDWIRKVRYYPSLQCFISCATASNTSMYLGDVERKKTSSMFRIRKGITSFDYCKEWNVIVTGGHDHYVRLWNPYVTAKATSVLKGHSSAVTHILVNSDKGEIISAAQDKVIKIWDMRDLCCVQTIPARSLLPGPHVITSLYYNSKSHCIFLGTNQLSVIEGKKEEASEEHDVTSHFKPLCAAIYNDLFDQVVSACHDSVVCVWSLETGEKIIQFSNAHGSSEITAMRFDPSKRRLITGGRDGTVRIWNFNNGCCLSELQAVDNEEITGILCFKQKIITVGWNRNVTIYKDCRDEEEGDPRVWPHFHEDDILSAAMYPTGLVATSSYDGLVKVWNIESGSVNCRLHAGDYGLERTQSVIPAEVKRLVTHCNSVIETEKRIQEEMSRKRGIHSDSSKKNRRIASSVGRLKNCPMQKERLESSQKRKSHLQDLPPLKSQESYHDSSVDKVIFLEKRENSIATATLLTSGSDGSVRAWSVCGGGLLGYFTAAQGDHNSVLSMTTNGDNSLLITGDTAGFIKLWNISWYCISSGDQKPAAPLPRKLSLGNRRNSQKPGKAGGIDTKPPPLVTSFRAHLEPIVSLDFVDNRQLIISASKDASVRLWTQTGRYIGLFGQRVLWDLEKAIKGLRRLPPDIQRIASAETLRRMLSSPGPRWRLAKHVMHITTFSRRETQSILQDSSDTKDWENEWGPSISLSLKNILGKFYKPKIRHKPLPPLPKLKFNQDQMIVYSCLNFKDLQAVEEPKTPAVLCSHNTRQNSSSGLLPRIIKNRGHRENSDSKHITYFSASVKQPRASTSRKPLEILRASIKK